MQNLSTSTSGFRPKDDYNNLLCCKSPSARTLPLLTLLPVCPVHYTQFNEGLFALVPSSGQREYMISFEEKDFERREESIR